MKIESNPHGSLWISIHSGDDEYPCRLSIAAFRRYFTQQLPAWVLRPYQKPCQYQDRKFTIDYDRCYGVSLTENYLSFDYGCQTGDSNEDKQKGFFLPWGEWEHIRCTLYNLDGSIHTADTSQSFEDWDKARNSVPKAEFNCRDYDGMEFVATAYIEEREWRRGVSWFKWLRLFVKPKIRRSLDLEFSKGIGREKDYGKGGTTCHGIEMQPDESVEAAFRRYCTEHEISITQ
ncbi:hypothetical protein D0962_23310 [Leptolyngbyaceae cyanobacterium CCMR0082]|uniref:Uncharacterized protein n=1 Tax=Adonisia turfae CCMR0082 TaxID=2304604 RepID=A0A6M0SAX5_9CYAN|nr:hypothetical protein [Adonisia turfae]NEZ65648.1 hypothetical protein [Adonisia turfae CCMR0082]